MPKSLECLRLGALCASGALMISCPGGGSAEVTNQIQARVSKPIGPATPSGNVPTSTSRFPPITIEQQKKPYQIIKVSYIPVSHWKVTMEVIGGVWTPWNCEPYQPAPPGKPTIPERCIGIPKDQTALLRVRLDGLGTNMGKTAYIAGAAWSGDCAGTVGSTCKLVMDKSHDVTALTNTFS